MSKEATLRGLVFSVLVGWTVAVAAHPQAPAAPAPPLAPGAAPATQGPGGAGRQGGRGAPATVVIGPSAPVPPEVAMLRPSAEELAQINAAMGRFINTDQSAAKPLLQKYESLLMVQPPRLNTAATFTQTTQRMGPRHEGFVDIAKAGNIDFRIGLFDRFGGFCFDLFARALIGAFIFFN